MGNRYSYYGTAKDQNGKVIASATVSVYLAGTTTVASVYTASSGGSAVNSVTSGASTSSAPGYFIFWIDRVDYVATQQFKITISMSGFNTQTYDYISVFAPSEFLPVTGTPAQGDILYHNGTNYVLLSAGTSGYILETQGAAANPVWYDLAGNYLAIPASSAQGDILIRGASGWIRLAASTSGYLLKTQGAGGNAAWTNAIPDHSADHKSAGSYPIKIDDLAAPDNNTDLNASTSAHGLLLKLDNDSTHFMNGQGAWASTTGKIVQVVNTLSTANTPTAALIPFDNTIPQKTEGTELFTCAITPTSATNKLLIEISLQVTQINATGTAIIAALFQDTTANALAAGYIPATVNLGGRLTFDHYMTSGTTSATTFKVNGGSDVAGSPGVRLNGDLAGAAVFNGTCVSSITITEISV